MKNMKMKTGDSRPFDFRVRCDPHENIRLLQDRFYDLFYKYNVTNTIVTMTRPITPQGCQDELHQRFQKQIKILGVQCVPSPSPSLIYPRLPPTPAHIDAHHLNQEPSFLAPMPTPCLSSRRVTNSDWRVTGGACLNLRVYKMLRTDHDTLVAL